MGEDVAYHSNCSTATRSNLCLTSYVKSFILTVEKLLTNAGHSLSHFHFSQPTLDIAATFGNRLIMDELAYDVDKISVDANNQLIRLNVNQRSIYDAILGSVNGAVGQHSSSMVMVVLVKHFFGTQFLTV